MTYDVVGRFRRKHRRILVTPRRGDRFDSCALAFTNIAYRIADHVGCFRRMAKRNTTLPDVVAFCVANEIVLEKMETTR